MSIRQIAVLAAALTLLTSAAEAAQAVTLDDVALLAGPVATSSAIGHLTHGAKVGVLWCGPELTFCLVNFHAKAGWVPADELGAFAMEVGAVVAAGSKSALPVAPVHKPDPAVIASAIAPPPLGGGFQLGGNGPAGPVNPINPKKKP